MKTELYTAFQLSAIRITAAVMLLAAVIGSVLHWVLRHLEIYWQLTAHI